MQEHRSSFRNLEAAARKTSSSTPKFTLCNSVCVLHVVQIRFQFYSAHLSRNLPAISIVGDGKGATGHTINVATAADEYYLLVVDRYRRYKYITPTGEKIITPTFMIGGHRWCIHYYPNGKSMESAAYISLFLQLVDTNVAEDLNVQFEFSFVNQFEKQDSTHIRATKPKKFNSLNSWGYPKFMHQDKLEKSNHLKGDYFIIRCDIVIVTTRNILIKVPPSGIQQHFSDLLQSKEGTDVTFKVGCQTFVAHRCVLAARSAVFKAELFGPMKEGAIASVIHIEEMDANVFSALLKFIYTDSLPKMEIDKVEEEGETQEPPWLQDLLAAADRYDLQRLKALCEEKLCEHIDARSVATIFTFAERHNCCGLKEVCLEFLKNPDNLKEIMVIDGLDYISTTCPSLMKELFTGGAP